MSYKNINVYIQHFSFGVYTGKAKGCSTNIANNCSKGPTIVLSCFTTNPLKVSYGRQWYNEEEKKINSALWTNPIIATDWKELLEN